MISIGLFYCWKKMFIHTNTLTDATATIKQTEEGNI